MIFNRSFLTCLFLFFSLLNYAQIKVTCIGASITEGACIENPKENSYPGQLQSLLGKKYKVSNFGVSSSTMLKKGNFPYWETDAFQHALQSAPDIVLIDLGGNDAKAINRPYYNELELDCRDMIRTFKDLPSHPRVIILLPTPTFVTDTAGIYDSISKNEICPRLQKAAYKEEVEVVNMHSLFIDRPDLFPDQIHPLEKGYEIMAKRLFQQITFPIDDGFDIFKILDNKGISYRITNFFGFECAEFSLNERDCKIVKPHKTEANHPWIWRARFWAHEPQVDITLLEKGYHLVFCDQAERMGNKRSIKEWNDFYQLLHKGGMNKKVVLEGMSRGSVYVLNWAAANPDKVAAVYVDNPLLDMKAMYFDSSGKQKQGNAITKEIEKSYGISPNNIKKFNESPIDKIDAIIAGKYPILILCAELDDAVTNTQNTFSFQQRIKEKGGNITVIEKKGLGHHPHCLPNPTPIVDFIEKAVNKDALTMVKKYDSYKSLAMTGYQGWFSCPSDGSNRGWYHYCGKDGEFRPGSCKIDMWPDVSEYDKIYKTAFQFSDGKPAYTMSSWDESTVETHFRWMREYGIDGAFIQRFVVEMKRPASYSQLNKVWHSAVNSANANNRAICIMYDLSGMESGDEKLILSDIDSITSHYDIFDRINNPSYLFHNENPLVAVWGIGFNDQRKYGFHEAEIIIDSLKARGFSVMIGVPTFWRKLKDDTLNDPKLHHLIKKCDIVMPWFVGRFRQKNLSEMKKTVKDDMKWCYANGVDYVPLAYPGFSWVNMVKNSEPIPRNRGQFYWTQLVNHINHGAKMLYLAMFDEIDEGTAIFKCATQIPVGASYFLALDDDLGSDYYLRLAGKASQELKKSKPRLDKKIHNL
jgi:lysophospholipase L1-like esterase